MIVIAMCAAFTIWYICMPTLGNVLKWIDTIAGPEYDLPRVFFGVFIYSLAVIEFNKRFKVVAGSIVRAENHKYAKDFEESMIRKNYTLGAFNSYLGMSAASFFFKKFSTVCMLLLTVLMFKQIIMNLLDTINPRRAFDKKLNAFNDRIRKF